MILSPDLQSWRADLLRPPGALNTFARATQQLGEPATDELTAALSKAPRRRPPP